MDRIPSSTETPQAKPTAGSLLNMLRNPRARFAAALVAALAAPACGAEEEEPKPPVCETPERADAAAPRVTVRTDNIELEANRIRIYFDVPEFDAECRAPFTVHAKATLWRPAQEVPLGEEPTEEPLSDPNAQLRGETEVYEPGEGYFLDAEFPPSAARISSIVLHVVDAAGEEYTTPPFSPLE